MDGLKIWKAATWDEIEGYANHARTCIGTGKTNREMAKLSFEHDYPRPVYVLLEFEYQGHTYKGYWRLLAVAGAWWSDFFQILNHNPLNSSNKYLPQDVHQNVFRSCMEWFGEPILSSHSSWGGLPLKWVGAPLHYQRVNAPPCLGTSVYLVVPAPTLYPVGSNAQTETTDASNG